MIAEFYASDCCGSVFVPGFGPDNIVDNDDSALYDAIREGDCPACGAEFPDMMCVFGYPRDIH